MARLATLDPDGTPHNVPVCPVLDGDRVYVASGEDRKVRNIRANARVGIVFDDYVEVWDDLRQVLVHGTASLVGPGPRFAELRDRFYDKFPQYPTMGGGIDEGDTILIEISFERVVSSGI